MPVGKKNRAAKTKDRKPTAAQKIRHRKTQEKNKASNKKGSTLKEASSMPNQKLSRIAEKGIREKRANYPSTTCHKENATTK